MTTTALETYVSYIDQELTQAWAALCGARAAATRSPNCDTMRAEDRAEHRVNELLDRRHRATT